MENKILQNIEKKKLTANMLRRILNIKGGKAKATFFSTLKKLEEEKKIFLDEDGYYQTSLENKKNLVKGVLHISKTGHGKVYISSMVKYIIKEEDLNGSLEGDTVLIKPEKTENAGYTSAKVVKILERKEGKAIFEFDGKQLKPYDIYGNIVVKCSEEALKGLVSGNLVLVNLSDNPVAIINKKVLFEGQIEEVIGHKDDPDIEVKAIGANHGFMTEFSKEALEELRQIPNHVTEEEMIGRVDLRDKNIFTIDGSHTKDMDDAISIDINAKGNFILSVHIADVNHYVKKGSYLDKEARERGTSAYLADSVIPMLPHTLSNGICSLNEGEDRLTKTVEMEIDDDGNVVDYKIFDSIINSKKKMTYEDVNEFLMNNNLISDYEPFTEDLLFMYLLSEILENKRNQRGNIDFTSTEVSVIEEEDTIFKLNKGEIAEKIIENFMILTNETVTKHYASQKLPFVYRVHANPNNDRLIRSLRYLLNEGLCGSDAIHLINKIEKNKLTSNDLEDFLNRYRSTEVEEIISVAILTSMSKARYSDQNEGHYGLALDYYTHFTSPIRRYPDLEVHRLIDEYKNENTEEKIKSINMILPEICAHSSFMERQADEAEKETLELKMAEYSINHIGDEYRGQITAFTPYGLDVILDNRIKGIANLNDITLPTESDKYKLKLGQRVYALIKDVSIPHRAIYLSIIKADVKRKSKRKVLIPKI
ncbi:MAG: VacB/RNase II family 3'-5' exoribonuclease [Bacilli bacterium]|nr:VacB/RNase II family 3'-5' exoribonuclease [Bacilli bacterium]